MPLAASASDRSRRTSRGILGNASTAASVFSVSTPLRCFLADRPVTVTALARIFRHETERFVLNALDPLPAGHAQHGEAASGKVPGCDAVHQGDRRPTPRLGRRQGPRDTDRFRVDHRPPLPPAIGMVGLAYTT